MRSKIIVVAFSLIGAAGSAQAFDRSLTSDASAAACGSGPCVLRDMKTKDMATDADVLTSAESSTLVDGSYAHGSTIAMFGMQKVYTDAFRAAGDTSGDAQAHAEADYTDISVAKPVDSTFNFNFAIAGVRTPTDTVFGAVAAGHLYYRITELKSYGTSKAGSWDATDSMPSGVVSDSFFVPANEQIRLEVEFSASAYTNNNDNPGPTLAVVSDYSHTVHTYVGSDTGPVGFESGHDYSLPVAGAVPEPASWALMLGGVGLSGAALRRRRILA